MSTSCANAAVAMLALLGGEAAMAAFAKSWRRPIIIMSCLVEEANGR